MVLGRIVNVLRAAGETEDPEYTSLWQMFTKGTFPHPPERNSINI
jgi:hypothetical protein